MQEITFDIETGPTADQAFIDAVRAEIEASVEAECGAVRAPANYKDAVKIEEWHATVGAQKIADIRASAESQIAEKIRATSLDGALGCIAVIGYAIDERPARAIYRDGTDPAAHEKEVIREFFDLVDNEWGGARSMPRWIGHNLTGFDLRFLFQRAVVLGIRPPACIPFHAKPWDDNVFDTMVKWAGAGNRVKLDKLCRALGLPGKQGFDGSQVAEAIAAGKIAEVAKYCAEVDVEQTRAVYKRLTFAGVQHLELAA